MAKGNPLLTAPEIAKLDELTYRISTVPRENGTIVAVVTLPPEHKKDTEAERWVAASKAAEIMARELTDQLSGIGLGSGVDDE